MRPLTERSMDKLADRCANAMGVVVVLGVIALILAACGVIDL